MRLSSVLPFAGAALLAGLLPGCRSPQPAAAPPRPLEAVFHPAKLAELDATITNAIAQNKCPGGVLWLERDGVAYHRAYGQRAVLPEPEPMTEDTLFDAASLTKVVACTPAVMLLVERGQVRLDAPVSNYLPEFTGGGRELVTVRHLLTHTSGLRPDISLTPAWSGLDAALKLCWAENLTAPPGTRVIYSDTGPILLGEIVRRITGRPLDAFVEAEIYRPLQMHDTGFNPPVAKRARIAPTEVENGQPLRGVVHDPRARRLGGVAGHAGLFTTAADLARFARLLLAGGELDGVRLFQPETVHLMTSVQTPPSLPRRGLGWDIDSPYAGPRGELFPLGSYGHTGWTGTSIWIDPFSRTFVIFLSNRNHPTEAGNVIALRRALGTLAAQAVVGFNFSYVPGALSPEPGSRLPTAAATTAEPRAPVLNGIDVLVKRKFAPLRGLRVGLITNQTGHDRDRRPTIDLLRSAPEVQLVALFSPEHGLRGVLDEAVGDTVDEPSGLPVYSLYGETRAPRPAQLAELDALVFDVQDIGCRFYTYISTLGLCLEAAAQAGKKFFVLDRVNPNNCLGDEGQSAAPRPSSPSIASLRHGMTVGELPLPSSSIAGATCKPT
ncbi:MAG: serine hydrolase [Verrucomicrobiales bacterium]|nr:serine hydrolase [Verrucomicrobiales bacterium]